MSVICLASLKGGVGKTSLSVNLAHAFAARGCETLLIDLDPTGHASRLFRSSTLTDPNIRATFPRQSPLARLMFAEGFQEECQSAASRSGSLVDFAASVPVELCYRVRSNLQVLPASADLRYFLWGRGAKNFSAGWGQLLNELGAMFDYIIIDTAPDFNVITRNALAAADVIAVPVDSSEMSIYCLEDLIESASHIQGPTWVIARTMLNRQASRVQRLASSRLQENFERAREGAQNRDTQEVEDPDAFIGMLRRREERKGTEPIAPKVPNTTAPSNAVSPIYLLNAVVHRTELQNKLTFLSRTAFDDTSAAKLADEYLAVAREIDEILALLLPATESPEVSDTRLDRFFEESLGLS